MMFMNRHNKPLIAITSADKGNRISENSVKLAVKLVGGHPVVISPSRNLQAMASAQGLILSGGQHIHPSRYGADDETGAQYNFERDALELDCLAHAAANQLPVLGICRGAQLLNVWHGGTLHQRLSDAYTGFRPVHSTFWKVFCRRPITIDAGSHLSAIMKGRKTVTVNSMHEQGMKEVAKPLRVVARDKIGIAQAVESINPASFMVGVQWHPEYLQYRREQLSIFASMVRATQFPVTTPNFETAVTDAAHI